MKIRLISGDTELQRLCREALAGVCGSCEFAAAPPNGEPPAADLCIWDFDPEMVVPQELDFDQEPKNIFLVHRKQLGALRDRFPMAALAVLLKPVNQPALRTFLEQALARYEANRPGNRDGAAGSAPSDREDFLQCLLQANLRLQEYDQERTNFLARAVHDFRTPLTAVSGYCGLLLSQQLGPLTHQQVEVLLRMHSSINRLSRLATGMLQLSTGRQLKKTPELRPDDIEACIQQAIHEVESLAEEKGIAISLHVESPPQALHFDRAQIEQVLINLLENACRFTPKYGSLEIDGCPVFWERRAPQVRCQTLHADHRVAISRVPNAFRIQVHDSGPGIPADQAEKIFEEYTSYAGGRDRSGAGLGLAICKTIVSAHQGRVWAEAGGEGAVFSFVLPLVPAQMPLQWTAHPPDSVISPGPGSQSAEL